MPFPEAGAPILTVLTRKFGGFTNENVISAGFYLLAFDSAVQLGDQEVFRD